MVADYRRNAPDSSRRHTSNRLDSFKAAFHLYLTQPKASAGRDLSPPWVLILPPAAYVGIVFLIAPMALFASLVGFSLLIVFCLTAVRMAASLNKPRYSPKAHLVDAALPQISVIIALYNEAEVIPGLLASLSRLDYPPDRLEILLALESHDHKTRTAALAAAHRAPIRVLSLPPKGPMTKPRALNFALQLARGELIAVYDAEDAPSSSQLRAAAEAFASDPRLGVVQAPLGWYNRKENWLTAQFSLEYAAQFHALLPLYQNWRCPLPLGGTSNMFRRAALEACGAWDPFNVTEDADLGFRLARHGWRAGLIEPGTLEEAPVTTEAWIGQRSRWLKGHLITWMVHMRSPRALIDQCGWRGFACLQITLLANMLSALCHGPTLIASVMAAGVLGATGQTLPAIFVASVTAPAYVASMACAFIGAKRAGFTASSFHLLTMPVYWLLQAPAAFKALRELPSSPYVWDKTQHGVSTARRKALDDADGHIGFDGNNRRRFRPVRVAQQSAVKSA